MEIAKIAYQYKVKLAQIFSKGYKDLLELNSMLFAYTNAIDIYDDETVASAMKEAGHNVAIATQRAYDSGISASDLAYLLNKAKTKLMLVSSLGDELDQDTKRMVGDIMAKLTAYIPTTIPQQKPAAKQQNDSVSSSSGPVSTPAPTSDFTLFESGLVDS